MNDFDNVNVEEFEDERDEFLFKWMEKQCEEYRFYEKVKDIVKNFKGFNYTENQYFLDNEASADYIAGYEDCLKSLFEYIERKKNNA